MEFRLKGPFRNTIYNLMRGIGYHYIEKIGRTGEIAFVNPVGGNQFPRYHLYIKTDEKSGDLLCDIHIDQKAPIYKGYTAHSGEYSGPVVEREAKRIQGALK